MNKLGYKRLEIRGYFGMLAMGGNDISRDHRYTKIYFESPETNARTDYKPSENSFVYYSHTDEVRKGSVLGRTGQAAEKAVTFVKNSLDSIPSSIRKGVAKRLNPLG